MTNPKQPSHYPGKTPSTSKRRRMNDLTVKQLLNNPNCETNGIVLKTGECINPRDIQSLSVLDPVRKPNEPIFGTYVLVGPTSNVKHMKKYLLTDIGDMAVIAHILSVRERKLDAELKEVLAKDMY